MANWLEKMRRWVDGEEVAESGFNKIVETQISGSAKTKSELFLQKLYEALVENLKEEVTRIPNTNKAYIPSSFAIFLSETDNRELRQDKREFFAEKLGLLVHEKAREIAKNLELSAKKIKIEFRLDGNLAAGEIAIRTYSANSDKTEVLESNEIEEIRQVLLNKQPKPLVTKYNEKTFDLDEEGELLKNNEILGTVDDFATNFGIFYRIEIWQAGKKVNDFPIVSRKITVGREGGSKTPNLKLQTDNQKISGNHAEISIEPNGEILITGLHQKNPTIVAGKRLSNGEQTILGSDQIIEIYDFVLKLKFGN